MKCRLETCDGQWQDKIPAWIKWATQEWNEILFNGKTHKWNGYNLGCIWVGYW